MKNRAKWVVTGAVILAVAAALMVTLKDNSLEYSPTRANNRAGPIVIKAKNAIDAATGSYSIEPQVKGDLQIIDNYIIFWPEEGVGFTEGERYRATFRDYRTISGENLKSLTLSFSVDSGVSYSALQQEVLEKYGHLEGTANPFLQKLPHTEPYLYRVSYVINDSLKNQDKSDYELLGNEKNWKEKKANYTVVIETLVNQGRNDDINKYRQDVMDVRQRALAWIREQGVDTSNDIVYVFVPDDAALTTPPVSETEIEID